MTCNFLPLPDFFKQKNPSKLSAGIYFFLEDNEQYYFILCFILSLHTQLI